VAFSTGGGNGGDDYSQIAEMNVIPLVDVMLVLLIIMMVTAPFLEQGVRIELPVAKGQNLPHSQAEAPLILYVLKDKNLRIGEQPVTRADLTVKLRELMGRRKDKELFVRADKDVPYGSVAEVMAQAKAAGVERVGLVTQTE
jgi:biopolymer transport protein TolR